MTNDSLSFSHQPVMLDEVLDVFAPIDSGIFVDATVGGGGHARALLDAHDRIELIGFDRDPAAVAAAARELEDYSGRVVLTHASFETVGKELEARGIAGITGILFDLGVSSHQLDTPDRGFSFRAQGELDMRMDPTSGQSAAKYLDQVDQMELATVIAEYGDERYAGRISKAILKNRPISSTTQLARVVADAMPGVSRQTRGHPARRTFQAIRIALNEELKVIEPSLHEAISRLVPGGRGAVLSYHSGEDRIVKRKLRSAAGLNKEYLRGLPDPPGETPQIELLHRGGLTPSVAELAENPRSSSARLRSFERLGATA